MKLKYLKFWHSLGALGLLIILMGSLLPQDPLGVVYIPNLDKLIHFIAYFIASLYYVQIVQKNNYKIMGIILFVFSFIIEVLQYYSETRSAEWLDLLANAFGIIAGIYLGSKVLQNFVFFVDRGISQFIKRLR